MATPWEEFLAANAENLAVFTPEALKSWSEPGTAFQEMERNHQAMIAQKIGGPAATNRMRPERAEELMAWGNAEDPYLLPVHVKELIEKKGFKPEAFQFSHYIQADNQKVPSYRLVPVPKGANTFEEMVEEEEPRKLGLTIVGNPYEKLAEEMETDE